MNLPYVTATAHRWLVGLGAVLVAFGSSWATFDYSLVGISPEVAGAVTTVTGVLIALVNVLRSATDRQT